MQNWVGETAPRKKTKSLKPLSQLQGRIILRGTTLMIIPSRGIISLGLKQVHSLVTGLTGFHY